MRSECGIRQTASLRPFISNGYPSEPGDWPWHVAIFMKSQKDQRENFICGGTIITESKILTGMYVIVLIKLKSKINQNN